MQKSARELRALQPAGWLHGWLVDGMGVKIHFQPPVEIQRVWRGRIARKRLEDVLPLLRKKWWERNSPLGSVSIERNFWRLNVCHGVWGASQNEFPLERLNIPRVSFYPFEIIPDVTESRRAGNPLNWDDRGDNINYQFGSMLVGFAEESPNVPRSLASRDKFFCPGGPGGKWTKSKNFMEFSYLFDGGIKKMDREDKITVPLSSQTIKRYPGTLFRELSKKYTRIASRRLIEGLRKELGQPSFSPQRSRLSPYATPFIH
jgi:hypothetical protein